jgi:hypothetical protein
MQLMLVLMLWDANAMLNTSGVTTTPFFTHSPLCSLALLHPASVGRKVASRVLTAPSPPTSSAHKSSARHPYFSALFGSKVTTLDLLIHWILYFFVLLSRVLCSFTSNLAIVILLDLQMKMHLLFLEFMALYIRGVQLVSLIVLSIGSPNQCFVNKVDEVNEGVPIDMDMIVLVKAQDDMEIDNDPVEVDNDLQDIMEIHNDPMVVD